MKLFYVSLNNGQKSAGVVVMAESDADARTSALELLGRGFWDYNHILNVIPQIGNAVRVYWENVG